MGTRCGAIKRGGGGRCKYPAGFGTDHLGEGRCYLHDGGGTRVGAAKLLAIVCREPELAQRAAEFYVSEDLLSPRRELAVLKARFEHLQMREDDSDIPLLTRLADSIAKTSKIIQEMEVGRRHMIHISVAANIVSAFSQVGQEFIQDPLQRERFVQALESHVQRTIRRTSARAVASELLLPGSILDFAESPEEDHD